MKNRIESIQALRGIAAFIVVLFHYRLYLQVGDHSGNTVWDAMFGWGIMGVDLFFVISGFVMVITTVSYPANFKSSAKFIINRIIRIAPTYYLVLLFSFLFGGAMSIFHYADKTHDLVSALLFMPSSTEFSPQYIDINHGLNPVRWTLNYEIYFYIIFAACLICKFRVILLAAWCALLTLIIPYFLGDSITFSTEGYKVNTALYGFLSNPMIIEFLIGAVTGAIYVKLKNYNFAKTSLVISPLLFIYIAWNIHTGTLRGLDVISAIPVSLLVLSLSLSDNIVKSYIPKFLSRLGDISFSLYLIHIPLILLLFKHVKGAASAPLNSIPYVILAIILSIILSILSNKYIELKFSKWLKRKYI